MSQSQLTRVCVCEGNGHIFGTYLSLRSWFCLAHTSKGEGQVIYKGNCYFPSFFPTSLASRLVLCVKFLHFRLSRIIMLAGSHSISISVTFCTTLVGNQASSYPPPPRCSRCLLWLAHTTPHHSNTGPLWTLSLHTEKFKNQLSCVEEHITFKVVPWFNEFFTQIILIVCDLRILALC